MDLTEICESVKVVEGEDVVIEVRSPRSSIGAHRFKKVLGSLEASMAACIVAAKLKLPIYVASEVEEGRVKRIVLRICRE